MTINFHASLTISSFLRLCHLSCFVGKNAALGLPKNNNSNIHLWPWQNAVHRLFDFHGCMLLYKALNNCITVEEMISTVKVFQFLSLKQLLNNNQMFCGHIFGSCMLVWCLILLCCATILSIWSLQRPKMIALASSDSSSHVASAFGWRLCHCWLGNCGFGNVPFL